ncbi:MAG: HYR domain-containing protein [Saprospiraceae bacterium]|nr:HYR domain-containing protein [Saprospiraceae bacterium]
MRVTASLVRTGSILIFFLLFLSKVIIPTRSAPKSVHAFISFYSIGLSDDLVSTYKRCFEGFFHFSKEDELNIAEETKVESSGSLSVVHDFYGSVSCPPDVSLNVDPGSCSAVTVNLGTPTCTPDCSGITIENDAPLIFPVGETLVNWTFRDSQGNTSSCSQKVTVIDNEAPHSIYPHCSYWNKSDLDMCLGEALEINADLGLLIEAQTFYFDNCGYTISFHWGTISDPTNSDCEWTIRYTFAHYDPSFNVSYCDITYSGGDRSPPELINSEVDCSSLDMTDQSICLSDALNFDPSTLELPVASLYDDGCGTVMAEFINTVADEANSDSFWVFTYEYAVKDVCHNAVSCYVVYSGGDHQQPIALCRDILILLDGQGVTTILPEQIDSGSTDDCGIAHISLSKTDFSCLDKGMQTVVLTVTDYAGNFDTCHSVVTVVDDLDPTISCPPDIYTVTEPEICFNGDLNLGSPAIGDNCNISMIQHDAPDYFPIGETLVKWTATDQSGNQSFCNQLVSVVDAEIPTTIPGASCSDLDMTGLNMGLDEAEQFNGLSLALDIFDLYQDNCGISSVGYYGFNANPQNSNCSWTLDHFYIIFDVNGLNTWCEVTYSGGETEAPELINSEIDCNSLNLISQTICLSEALSFDPSTLESAVSTLYSDNYGMVTASHSITTPGSSNNDCSWSFTFEFIIKDACENTTTCQVTYSGGDTEAPILVDSQIECSSLHDAGQNLCLSDAMTFDATSLEDSIAAIYTDCGGVQVELTNTIAGESNSDCDWSFIYQYIISDGCGNSTTCDITYSGGDTEAPRLSDNEIDCSSLDMTGINQCLGNSNGFDPVTLETSVAALHTDNCSVAIAVYTRSFAGENNSDVAWEFTHEFNVKDACDNSISCFVTYSGGDTEVPSAVCQDIEITLDSESGLASITPGQIDTGSSDNCGIATTTLDKSAFTCADVGEQSVTMMVTDNAGNMNTCPAMIMVLGSAACGPVPCTPTMVIDATFLANDPHQMLFHAGKKLSSDGIITSGENIDFRAGEEVELLLEFEVQSNAIMTIAIQDCIPAGGQTQIKN